MSETVPEFLVEVSHGNCESPETFSFGDFPKSDYILHKDARLPNYEENTRKFVFPLLLSATTQPWIVVH